MSEAAVNIVRNMAPTVDLLPELWARVFVVLVDSEASSALLSSARVCKAWNTLCSPHLFRFIWLKDRRSLSLLAQQFIDTPSGGAIAHPGMLIKTLALSVSSEDRKADYMEDVVVLLAAMNSLRQAILFQPIHRWQLHMLATNCSNTLSSLNILFVNKDKWPSSAFLRLLSQIQRLEILHLTFKCQSGVWSAYGFDTIDFPHLHTISYTGRGSWHNLGLEALCRMRLPSLHTLSMDLPNFSGCAQYLEVLFKNNLWLENLHIELPRKHSHTMFACPITVERLSTTFVPLSDPSSSVNILNGFSAIELITNINESDDLADFLSQLALEAMPYHRLRTIQVTIPQHFSWIAAGLGATQEYRAFVGTMLHLSAILQRKGIELLDETGRRVNVRAVDNAHV